MGWPILTVAEPKLIKQILIKDFHILPNRMNAEFSHPIISQSLILIDGNRWKRIRSITTPIFTSGKMKRMYPLMKQCLDDLTNYLSPLADQKSIIDVKHIYSRLSLDIVFTCSFANKLNPYNNDNQLIRMIIESVQFLIISFVAQTLTPKMFSKLLYNLGFFNTMSIEFVIKYLRQLLDSRRKSDQQFNDLIQLFIEAEHRDTDNNDSKEDMDQNKRAMDIKLDNNNNKLNEDEIIAQFITILFAAYETTTTTFSFLTYELAINEDCQQRLYDEVMAAVDVDDNGETTIDYDVLSGLTYLDACIKEALRLHSPVTRIVRKAADDYKLGDTGITIQKGQRVDIPISAIHYSEEYYPNANKFIPDRFLPENIKNIKPFTYLPFGCGPRVCIGQRFALLEMKLCLAHIIQKYRFFPSNKNDGSTASSESTTPVTDSPLCPGGGWTAYGNEKCIKLIQCAIVNNQNT
ncbi:cytochrome P450 9e2-like [Oppia nitens]|uniref:cytochrome P450 9e2-like n=1 Tax=Oppia nitens TaxID=1686743 RepID=UPI0023DC0722|nr:cytochrome P450 9e2-like [Oppia nitens]